MKKILYFASLLLIACNQKSVTNEALISDHKDSVMIESESLPHPLFSSILKSIPSPLETSNLIKHEGAIYDHSILRPTDSLPKSYHTNYEKALVLGMYGTDLGYVNIYNQNQDVLSYLNSIQGLAEELKIGQFFDYHTFKRLATNNHNMDSLLYLTVSNFEKMNEYLYEHKRSEHSVLIMTGGWLEALHISCKAADVNKSKLLQERIGEQKIVLDQLLILYSDHHQDNNMTSLKNKLVDLKKAFNEVKFENQYSESKKEEIDGVYVIKDQSKSKVEITEEQIKEIGRITKSIRDEIIL